MSRGMRYSIEEGEELIARLNKYRGGPGLPPVTIVGRGDVPKPHDQHSAVGHATVTGPPTPSKYRNVKTTSVTTGRSYASKKEAKRAGELHCQELAGQISGLREQVRYCLVPAQRDTSGKLIERKAEYVADFVYRDGAGRTVVEDAKGMRNATYILKRKLMLHVHGIRVREV